MAVATPQNAISSAASTSVSFATLPTAGSSVVVHVSQYRSGSVPTQPTIADNQGVGNVYTLAPSATATLTSGTDNWRVSIFVCKVIGATSGTFTITETATDGDRTLVCEEYTGTDTVNTVNISGNASAAAASTSISKLLASTVANCYGTAAMTGANASNPFSMTPANETANLVREEENNSTAQAICVGNGAVVSIGNHTGGFTHAASASVMAYVLLAPAIAGTAAVIRPAITLPNRFVGPLVLRQYSKEFYFDTTQAPLKNTEFILPSYPLNKYIGPPVLRNRQAFFTQHILAPEKNTEFGSGNINIPSRFVGPPILRKNYRQPKFPEIEFAPSTNTEFFLPNHPISKSIGPIVLRRHQPSIPYIGLPNPATTVTVPPIALTIATFAPQLKLVVTPSTTALVLTTFAPAAIVGTIVTPSTASLTLTNFAPVKGDGVVPSTKALVTTKFAPQLQEVTTPATKALATTKFAPVLKLSVIPTTRALTLTTFAPTVITPVTVTTGLKTLTLTTFAPTIAVGQYIVPSTKALSLTAFSPNVVTPSVQVPTTKSLSLTTFAPTIAVGQYVVPTTKSLSLSAFAPTIVTPQTIIVALKELTLSTFAPTLPQTATPSTLALIISTFGPVIKTEINVGTKALTLTTFAPTVTATVGGSTTATPTTAMLIFTGYAPQVVATGAEEIFPLFGLNHTVIGSLQFINDPNQSELILHYGRPFVNLAYFQSVLGLSTPPIYSWDSLSDYHRGSQWLVIEDALLPMVSKYENNVRIINLTKLKTLVSVSTGMVFDRLYPNPSVSFFEDAALPVMFKVEMPDKQIYYCFNTPKLAALMNTL